MCSARVIAFVLPSAVRRDSMPPRPVTLVCRLPSAEAPHRSKTSRNELLPTPFAPIKTLNGRSAISKSLRRRYPATDKRENPGVMATSGSRQKLTWCPIDSPADGLTFAAPYSCVEQARLAGSPARPRGFRLAGRLGNDRLRLGQHRLLVVAAAHTLAADLQQHRHRQGRDARQHHVHDPPPHPPQH